MHLSLLGWVSVSLGVVVALSRLTVLSFWARGKSRSEYAIFNTWMLVGALVVLIDLPAFLFVSCQRYPYVYWVIGVLYEVMEFGVIYELVVNALKPYSALIDLAKLIFTWAASFLLIAATITALTTVGAQASKIYAAGAVIERSLRLIECGILLLFFLFEKRLGLSWRNLNISIALGIGVTAVVDLASSYLRAVFPNQGSVFDSMYSLVFLVVLAYWSYCFLQRTRTAKSNVLDSPNRLIFQRWNEALISYQQGDMAFASNSQESFIPSVERAVDRVMARKMTR